MSLTGTYRKLEEKQNELEELDGFGTSCSREAVAQQLKPDGFPKRLDEGTSEAVPLQRTFLGGYSNS